MKITEALLGEHGVIYALFNHLEQKSEEAKDLTHVKIQVALLAAALESHAHIEDELLFFALDPYIGQMGPLVVMRQEHDEIERTLERLQNVPDLSEAQELVQHLIQVARDHFAKEEQVLFPMAEQTLEVSALNELGNRWAEQRLMKSPSFF